MQNHKGASVYVCDSLTPNYQIKEDPLLPKDITVAASDEPYTYKLLPFTFASTTNAPRLIRANGGCAGYANYGIGNAPGGNIYDAISCNEACVNT